MINNSFQLRRWHFINWFDSLPILVVRYLFLSLGAISLLAVTFSLFIPLSDGIIGLATLFLSPLILTASFTSYVHYLKSHPGYRVTTSLKQQNPVNNFNWNALGSIYQLQRTGRWSGFWQAAGSEPLAGEFLLRLGLPIAQINDLTGDKVVEPSAVNTLIKRAIELAEGETVTLFSVIEAALEQEELQDYIESQNIQPEDLAFLLQYYRGQLQTRLLPPVKAKTGGLARDWAISYTNVLDIVAPPLPQGVIYRARNLPVYSRAEVLNQVIAQLNSGNAHNIALTGSEGVGKTELFYHLAAKIYQYQTKTELDGLDIRSLDIPQLLSMASSPNELQQLLTAVFNDILRAGNIILFIDKMDLLLDSGGEIGTTDIAAVLESVAADRRVRIIATINSQKYLELVKPNSGLNAMFFQAEVTEPDDQELFGIVLSHLNQHEYHYHTFFMATAVRELITLGKRYIKDQSSPSRELGLVEAVSAAAHSRSQVLISPADVATAVEHIAKVPIMVKAGEQQSLLNLEANLHRRVIGQNAAIKQVSDALLRARAGLRGGSRPIGAFLFLGPTGVGKTETSKALAEIYFGSAQKLIRLDMTEYADSSGLQKLLGTDGKRDPGALAIGIQQSPSAVVLFDELEKASSMVKNALMPLLDEGRLTTSYGLVLDFTNTIVIATSNAGSDFIRAQVQSGTAVASFERQLVDQLISKGIFLTEFINRFDGVVVFTPLNPAEVEAVVALQVSALKNRLYKDKGITIDFAPAVLSMLAKKGYDPVFGARALQRVLANDLETVIAKKIISESPKAGSKIQIDSL